MPQGAITPEQRIKIQAWLKENWKGSSNCSVCLTNNWELAGNFVTPMIFIDGGISIGGGSYPQVMSICTNCGHTVYFNAMTMGVLEEPKKDKTQKEAADSGGGNG